MHSVLAFVWFCLSIKIRMLNSALIFSISFTDTSELSMVTLESAVQVNDVEGRGPPASWVEVCSCPTGFAGQFCELCATGFTRETPNGGPFTPCVPCNCNEHGTCHPETGKTC